MAPSSNPTGFALFAFAANIPLLWVLAISIVIGFLMVIVFRYTSDQKAIGRAKDRLKAHLLAVRLFQDQLPVVMRAYGKILRGTGSYLRLAFTPFLIAILPITFLIVQTGPLFRLDAAAAGANFSGGGANRRSGRPQPGFPATASGAVELCSSGACPERKGGGVACGGRARRKLRDPDYSRRADAFEAGRRGAGPGPGFSASIERQFLGAHLYLGGAGVGG